MPLPAQSKDLAISGVGQSDVGTWVNLMLARTPLIAGLVQFDVPDVGRVSLIITAQNSPDRVAAARQCGSSVPTLIVSSGIASSSCEIIRAVGELPTKSSICPTLEDPF